MHIAPDIRQSIAAAVLLEERSSFFRNYLIRRLPYLKKKLILPEKDPVPALILFTTRYIESVPGSISLVTAVSKQLEFYRYVAPFLHMAEDFFLHPPADVSLACGLEAMLDESFLVHRLLEEVNDYHIRNLGHPLLPLDMTEANIIVYHLLGEKLGSRLENLVQYASAELLEKAGVWKKARAQPGAARVLGFDGIDYGSESPIRIRATPGL
ncbi:MAG: hypothetical protein IMF06_13470 [Proteobacteria bacterium]|nr:hypothetical protein [Pseudomonadota bacterium]